MAPAGFAAEEMRRQLAGGLKTRRYEAAVLCASCET
jgi:hypothetical protein